MLNGRNSSGFLPLPGFTGPSFSFRIVHGGGLRAVHGSQILLEDLLTGAVWAQEVQLNGSPVPQVTEPHNAITNVALACVDVDAWPRKCLGDFIVVNNQI